MSTLANVIFLAACVSELFLKLSKAGLCGRTVGSTCGKVNARRSVGIGAFLY